MDNAGCGGELFGIASAVVSIQTLCTDLLTRFNFTKFLHSSNSCEYAVHAGKREQVRMSIKTIKSSQH